MKFVSKSGRLNVIISPGLSAQPLTGTPEKPRVSAQFEGGILEVKDEAMVEKLLAHPGFNRDFFAAEVGQPDPYLYGRVDAEPAHTITEIQFGHPVARKTGNPTPQLSPEVRKLLQTEAAAMATEMAKAMLPEMVKATLESMAKSVKDNELPETLEEALAGSDTSVGEVVEAGQVGVDDVTVTTEASAPSPAVKPRATTTAKK